MARKFIAVALLLVSMVGFCASYEDRKLPDHMMYSSSWNDSYVPNKYHDYKYGIVHTEQLGFAEYQLQRLDWLVARTGEIEKSLSDTNKAIGRIDDRLSSVLGRLTNLLGGLLVVGVLLLLVCARLLMVLMAIQKASKGNMKVLNDNIHAIYGKIGTFR